MTSSRTVLIYSSPARGHLFPIMDAALALSARGHSIRVRTLAAEVDTVERAGIAAKPVAAAIEARAIDDYQVRSPLASARRSVRTFVDRATLEVDDLARAIADEQPDVVLVDTNCWGAQAAAEASGLPWATWHPYPMPYPSRDAPPFGPGLAPARGVLGRVRDRLLQPIVTGPFEKVLPDLNAVRVRAGVAPLARLMDIYRAPPLVLHMTAEPFEYPRSDWLPNVRLVGPGLWAPSSTSFAAAPPLESDHARPVVLVTCSTEFQDDGALVDTALAAFGDDASVQLVCTTAGVEPARFAERAARCTGAPQVVRFAPHAALLPRACVVVCHGGMGITQRALSAGVPVCIVAWGRDQLEVAQRTVHADAGSSLARGRLSVARLRDAVTRARALHTGADGVRDAFARAGGAPRIAELVEELARDAGTAGRRAA